MAVFSKIAVIALGCMLMASIRLGADVENDAPTHPSHPSFKVYVSGEVLHPGEIEVKANENLTVSKAILRAGGFGDFAYKRRVELKRKKPEGTRQTINVDVKAFFTGHSTIDPVLQADDVVNVPSAVIN